MAESLNPPQRADVRRGGEGKEDHDPEKPPSWNIRAGNEPSKGCLKNQGKECGRGSHNQAIPQGLPPQREVVEGKRVDWAPEELEQVLREVAEIQGAAEAVGKREEDRIWVAVGTLSHLPKQGLSSQRTGVFSSKSPPGIE